MDMTDYICLCEIVMYEALALRNVLRAEVSVHANCIGDNIQNISMTTNTNANNNNTKQTEHNVQCVDTHFDEIGSFTHPCRHRMSVGHSIEKIHFFY